MARAGLHPVLHCVSLHAHKWLPRGRQAALLLLLGCCIFHCCPNCCQVRHRLSVRPSLAPPQKIGDITKKVFKKQVRGTQLL